MALHFVSTSVLTSEDGIDFSKEVQLESEEAKRMRIASEVAARKPLYMQLAEQKDKKQEEYDANTKLIFAPPRALDKEDVQFFSDLEENKSKALALRASREVEAIEKFKAAAKSKDLDSSLHHSHSKSEPLPAVIALKAAPAHSLAPPPLPKITAVRKKKAEGGDGEDKEVLKKQRVDLPPNTQSTVTVPSLAKGATSTTTTTTTTTATTTAANASTGAASASVSSMFAYSDSDSDDE